MTGRVTGRFSLEGMKPDRFGPDGMVFVFPGRGPFEKKQLAVAKQGVPESVTRITQGMVDRTLTSRPGVFRFVICAASNIDRLAVDRRDMMATRRTVALLKDRFISGANSHFGKRNVSGIVSLVAEKMAPEFEAVAKEMTITARWSDNRSATAKAYLVAELDRSLIEEVVVKCSALLATKLALDEEEQSKLVARAMPGYRVGWGGNPFYFMIEGFNDPLKK